MAFARILLTMVLEPFKYEWNAMLGLVIDDLRHGSGTDHICYGHATCDLRQDAMMSM